MSLVDATASKSTAAVERQAAWSKTSAGVCIVQDAHPETASTFIRAHADHLPARIQVIHGVLVPQIDNRPLLNQSVSAKAIRKALRHVQGLDWSWELTWGYLKAFRRFRPNVVLSEFGPSGVRVREACRRAGVPLVAHFHGLDATQHQYLEDHAKTYPLLFRDAAAVVGVSREMCRQLIRLGAPAEKVAYNTYGVDCEAFGGAKPESAPPEFIAIGRFVEKKAPHLTLLAFSQVQLAYPEARLRMIGDGPLLGACRDLATGLNLGDSVEFLGACVPKKVQAAMRHARAFVQHSVVAADGDCEGTPVAIIEAGASGLPVVATRHAGIPDVVIENETGFLVNERNVNEMARQMMCLAADPGLAGRMGRAARERIQNHFSTEISTARLWNILSSCMKSQPISLSGETDQTGL
jgi:glycosyltransferase involved in cell wall biosynthesis